MDEIEGDYDTRVMRENVAAGTWLAMLVTLGCILLTALHTSAQRDECVMRGGAICSEIIQARAGWSQPLSKPPKGRANIAEHLKNSRRW